MSTVLEPVLVTEDSVVEEIDATPDRLRPRRPSLHGGITAAIAALTAVLYLWNLSAVGYANSYYAAAVKSASVSWKAWFFGALDPGSFITVDKPPAALWLQGLSARIFGFSTASMIVPEILLGIGSVLLLHRLVRRWKGDVAAHLSAVALAITPIAVAMFRNNNPDAMLTFLGVAAAWFVWKAVETGRTRSLLAAAALTGLAFDTKMLQAFLVLPAFVVVYLVAGTPRLRTRLWQLAAALGALVAASGWWAVVVSLWPASARPYIGSTSDNSIWSLVLGYNGLGRIFGSSGSGAGGNGAGSNFGGTPGILRMFNDLNGGQIAWFLPLAGAGLLAGLWLSRRGKRTDTDRAGWMLWGVWALVGLAVFSFQQGIYHTYYTVQLAPAVAALAGAGSLALWRLGKAHRWFVWALPVVVAGTAVWSAQLLGRATNYHATLRTLILAAGVASGLGLLAAQFIRRRSLLLAAAGVAAVAAFAGPVVYSVTTVQHPVSGSLVSAGPTVAGGGMGGGRGAMGPSGAQGERPTGSFQPPTQSGTAPAGPPASSTGTAASVSVTSTGATASGAPSVGGGAGEATTADATLVAYLEANQGGAEYLVATTGSSSSASIILATGEPVITIGGFSGSDPAPTLDQLKALVTAGKVRYLLVNGNGGGGPGGNNASSGSITSWAESSGTKVDLGSSSSATLYDLSTAV